MATVEERLEATERVLGLLVEALADLSGTIYARLPAEQRGERDEVPLKIQAIRQAAALLTLPIAEREARLTELQRLVERAGESLED